MKETEKSISDEELAVIMAMPVLAFPYEFQGARIDSVDVSCSRCGNILSAKDIRGEFVPNTGGAVIMKGYGLCFSCQLVSPLPASRFRPDGTCLSQDDAGTWFEGCWTNKSNRSRIIEKVRQLLLRI